MEYSDFLKNKTFVLESMGFDVDPASLNPKFWVITDLRD